MSIRICIQSRQEAATARHFINQYCDHLLDSDWSGGLQAEQSLIIACLVFVLETNIGL